MSSTSTDDGYSDLDMFASTSSSLPTSSPSSTSSSSSPASSASLTQSFNYSKFPKLKIECEVKDAKGKLQSNFSQPLSIILPPTSLIGALRKELATYLDTSPRQVMLVYARKILKASEYDNKQIKQANIDPNSARLTAFVLDSNTDAERVDMDAFDLPTVRSRSPRRVEDKTNFDFAQLSASVCSNAELGVALNKLKKTERELADMKAEHQKLITRTQDLERQIEELHGNTASLQGLSAQRLREIDISLREATIRVSKRLLEENTRERQCIVCQEADRQVIFDSCGHACTCEACAKQIMAHDHTCPLDRKQIISYKRFYL